MTRLFTIHDVDEETPVQFLGVHPFRWKPEWGEPQAMFVEVDDSVYEAVLEACHKGLDGMYNQHPQYETMTDEELRHPDMDCYAVETILQIRSAIAQAEGGAQ